MTTTNAEPLDLVAACADRWDPDEVALLAVTESGGARQLTRRQLRHTIDDVAAMLRNEGVSVGDRVVTFLPNGVEAIVILFACQRVGATLAPISPILSVDDLADGLVVAGPSLIITADGLRRRGSRLALKPIADAAVDRAAERGHHVPRASVVYHERSVTVPIDTKRERWWHDGLARVTAPVTAPVGAGSEPVPLALFDTIAEPGTAWPAADADLGALVDRAQDMVGSGPGDRVGWFGDLSAEAGLSLALGTLASGAALLVYDGDPVWPDPDRVWEVAGTNGLTTIALPGDVVDALHASALAAEGVGAHGSPLGPDCRGFLTGPGAPTDAARSWLADQIGGGTRSVTALPPTLAR